ncbi:MAG: hypothetical protein ABEK12_03340, partial [Candidatus Nanohaloarchaea archaeon]
MVAGEPPADHTGVLVGAGEWGANALRTDTSILWYVIDRKPYDAVLEEAFPEEGDGKEPLPAHRYRRLADQPVQQGPYDTRMQHAVGSIFEETEVDIVYLATPDHLHGSHVAQIASAMPDDSDPLFVPEKCAAPPYSYVRWLDPSAIRAVSAVNDHYLDKPPTRELANRLPEYRDEYGPLRRIEAELTEPGLDRDRKWPLQWENGGVAADMLRHLAAITRETLGFELPSKPWDLAVDYEGRVEGIDPPTVVEVEAELDGNGRTVDAAMRAGKDVNDPAKRLSLTFAHDVVTVDYNGTGADKPYEGWIAGGTDEPDPVSGPDPHERLMADLERLLDGADLADTTLLGPQDSADIQRFANAVNWRIRERMA